LDLSSETRRCLAIKVWPLAETRQACQQRAINNNHDYYQYQAKADGGGLCGTISYCYAFHPVKNPWFIYHNPEAKTCTCTNGHPAESSDCTADNVHNCGHCNDGYSLTETSSGTKTCVQTDTVFWGPMTVDGAVVSGHTCRGSVKQDCPDRKYCQEMAARKRHRFYLFRMKNGQGKCWTGHYCENFEKTGWAIYQNPAYGAQRREISVVTDHQHASEFSSVCSHFNEELSIDDKFSKVHNFLRCLHGQNPLFWDPQVAQNAQTVADASAVRGSLEHSKSYKSKPMAGENLAAGSDPRWATTSWYDELIRPDYVYPGDKTLHVSGHFTAMIWRFSQRIGCGEASNGGFTTHACQYADEPSNMGDWNANVPEKIEWVNNKAFCCDDAFVVSDCDDDCLYQALDRTMPVS